LCDAAADGDVAARGLCASFVVRFADQLCVGSMRDWCGDEQERGGERRDSH